MNVVVYNSTVKIFQKGNSSAMKEHRSSGNSSVHVRSETNKSEVIQVTDTKLRFV